MVTSTSTPGSMEMEVICLTTSGRVEIDETLVDAHLETIPRVGTLTARRLPRGDAQLLGWHAHGSLELSFLLLAPLIKSEHTFSRFFTCLLVSVILILWMTLTS